jgi:hypothetical protein
MKKIFFFFAMLASVAASAQTLSIKIATIDYSTKIATCDLSWTARNATHLSDVWVFVDYIEISGNTTTGTWKPATVTGATITQTTTGNVTASTVSGNTRGVWIKSVSSGANFTGKIVLQLSGVPAEFSACAYASDYPPNAVINAGGGYTLKGTAPFTITYNESSATVTNEKTFNAGCITSITDATGNPAGIVPAAPTVTASAASSACAGAAVLFTATASGGTTTAMTYTWNIAGATSTTTATTYSKTLSTVGSNTYSVSVKNSNGCISAASPVKTVTVNTGATRDNAPTSCGCATGLTACNGYCRDLAADNASCSAGFEVSNNVILAKRSSRVCPDGWHWPTEHNVPSIIAAKGLQCAPSRPEGYWLDQVNCDDGCCRYYYDCTGITCDKIESNRYAFCMR